MFDIEDFIVVLCEDCRTRHAPIRGCPEEDRFVPSTDELRHWIIYGTDGCMCSDVCVRMRRLSDQDN